MNLETNFNLKKTLNEQDRFEPEIVETTFHFDNWKYEFSIFMYFSLSCFAKWCGCDIILHALVTTVGTTSVDQSTFGWIM